MKILNFNFISENFSNLSPCIIQVLLVSHMYVISFVISLLKLGAHKNFGFYCKNVTKSSPPIFFKYLQFGRILFVYHSHMLGVIKITYDFWIIPQVVRGRLIFVIF